MTERTSARVARIAGRILELKLSADDKAAFEIANGFTWADVRALAASCLNQAPDRAKKARKP